jgi:hypothetical protein
MKRYFSIKIFLFNILFFYIKSDEKNDNRSITVSHTVLIQESYYGSKETISNTFIDFTKYKIYSIDKQRIYHSEGKIPKFHLEWDDRNEITLACNNKSEGDGEYIKCATIQLQDHYFITFDIDRCIAKLGGVFTYLLVLYGFFSLRRGYVYFNLTIIFYSSFGFILFVREFCELLELKDKLNSEDEKSERILYTVFYFTLIISLLYGAACHISKYLKYITFGFINGLIFSKIFYYLLIKALKTNFLLAYFLLELFSCLIMIGLAIFIQNKYPRVSIVNISIIAGYGIIYGVNILFGGLPFLPYFIMAKKNKEEKNLFKKLVDNNIVEFYFVIYIVLIIYGYYSNLMNYRIAMNKKIKSNQN